VRRIVPHRTVAACLFALCVGLVSASTPEAPPVRLLDDFDDLSAWHLATSDEVKARLFRAEGSAGHALCLAFDFGRVSGYASVHRALPIEYGEDYEFAFGLRGDAPAHALQFKLVDASGENVWWATRPDYPFPRDWQRVRFKKRQIEFAWGPSKDHRLKQSATLELTIARGEGSSQGTVCFDRLTLRELPHDGAAPPAPVLHASSTLAPSQPADALDGRKETAWRSDPAAGAQQELTLDFGRPREFGGLILHWLPGAYASRYAIDFSDDGEHWRTVRQVVSGGGGGEPHLLPESDTRYLRLRLEDGPARAYGLAEIEVKDLAWGASPNAFFAALAEQSPRGIYPRAYVGEQSYWTVLGVSGGTAHGLLSEDGALEIGRRSGSLEPFLLTEEGLVTWADVESGHSLLDGYLPIPTVAWRKGSLRMAVTAFGMGDRDQSQLASRYTVENRSARPRAVTLALAVRPFQVNPPTQFLNTPGGVAPIHALSWDGQAVYINGERRLIPLARPDQVVVAPFTTGDIVRRLETEQPAKSLHPPFVKEGQADISTRRESVKDETGFASAVLLYRLQVPAHGRRSIGVIAPLAGAPRVPTAGAPAWLHRQEQRMAGEWRTRLNRVALRLPPAGRAISDTLRTALAHILISRSGPALQPGTRAYARSWIRDGAMMADALLRLGQAGAGREYADWFAGYQFTSGKVPCCVDRRGADPVAENDSHGEWIHLIAQQYRYTHDRAWLQQMWPQAAAAAAYMDGLRVEQRAAMDRTGKRDAWYGLMPASISHEGYSDRPAYSYWDDFWTLAGYDDAVDMARALGREEDLRRLDGARAAFERDLIASLWASIARHGIAYLPGSADRGDFDPAATTVALSVAGLQAELPQPALQQTFERYWTEFLDRRDGRRDWDDYAPYELRTVGAFVRLGWRERAGELMDFFLSHRRPAAWNQWAEVVGREFRRPRFLGDMPHGWIAADFIQSALDRFAYERREDGAQVLAAGVPAEWFSGLGLGVRNLQPPNGPLSWEARRQGRRLVLTIASGLTPPQGGVVFPWPYAGPPGRALLNGRPVQWENGKELRIRSLPAVVTVQIPPDQ
jgi:hypothetical protein